MLTVLAVAAAVTIFAVAGRDTAQDTLAIGPTGGPSAPAETTTAGPRGIPAEPVDAPSDTASQTAGNGPLFAGAPALSVVAVADEGLRFVDLATGDIRAVDLPGGAAQLGTPAYTLTTVGDRLVVSNGVDVVRLSADGSDPVRIAAEGRAVDTADDASIWVVDPLATGQPSRAVRVDLDGTVRDRIRLPAVARAYAGTVDGLVVWVPGGIVEVSGSASRTLTGGGEPAAVDGVRLARTDCAEALTCQVVIGALDDPDGGVRVPLAAEDIPGGFFGLPSGTFSPDGSRLALPIYRVDGRGGLRSTRVAVIDTVTGVEGDPAPPVRILRAADTALAWSPNGRWLVIGAAGGLTIWDAQRSEAHEIELPARVTGALLVPTPS